MVIHFTQRNLENTKSFLIYAYGFLQPHMIGVTVCLYGFTVIMYHTAGFFKEGNFWKFYKSFAIHENFTLEMFAENIISVSCLDNS